MTARRVDKERRKAVFQICVLALSSGGDIDMQTMKEDISEIKNSIADIMSLSITSSIPIALRKIMTDTFQCNICHAVPIKPPVIITKCCKTILGRDNCVNRWYSGPEPLTKSCPSCRAIRGRGYNETMLMSYRLKMNVTRKNFPLYF